MPIDDFKLESTNLTQVRNIWHIQFDFYNYEKLIVTKYALALINLDTMSVKRSKRIKWFNE